MRGPPGAGWRAGPALRVGAAVLAGAALSLAFPGPDLGPVAFVALVPLLLAVETVRPWRAAALGYVTGLTFIGVLIWWIPTDFLSWTGAAGWLAWVALCVAEASFVAVFAALVPACRRLGGWRVVLLPACWATLELLRAHGPIGGFPWGILGVGLDRGASTEAVFANHVARTEALGEPRPDLVIWGEGAVDSDPLTNPDRLQRIRRAAAAAGAPLLVGATVAADDDHYATEALLFTRDGALADRYRKRRLVPFGEYVPMAWLMGRILPVTREGVPFDKVPGHRLEPMVADGVRIGTIICWESAYAEDARTLAREGAGVIVVATNNASFGEGPASRQHLASSQLRAVEEGRTVVQAAVSGSSAIIGPDGVARQETGLYQQTTIRAAVAPRSGLTLYARFGQGIEATLVALAAVSLLLALLPWSRRRRAAGTA